MCVCATIVHSRRLRRIYSIKCSKLVSDIATHRTRQLVGHESNKFIYDSEFLRSIPMRTYTKTFVFEYAIAFARTNSRSINQFIYNEIMIIDVAFSFCFLCRAPRYHGTKFHSSTHINNIIWYCLNSSIDQYASACECMSSCVCVLVLCIVAKAAVSVMVSRLDNTSVIPMNTRFSYTHTRHTHMRKSVYVLLHWALTAHSQLNFSCLHVIRLGS